MLSSKKIILIFLCACNIIGRAQDMTEGFSYLEKGDFAKGEAFFGTILKEYPKNKTARICHARAVGLNKQAEKGLSLFAELRAEYPGDLEIDLNYAEAMLWNKKFDDAKVFYTKLVEENPENFVAHLGYANTLSNLKEFEDALFYVNRALEISPGNGGALVSRKYIKMGFGGKMVSLKRYEEAETFYNEVLEDFPNDKEILLNKANLYLITKSIAKGKEVYKLLYVTDTVLALNGLSLITHIDEKDAKALKIAETSIGMLTENTDSMLVRRTHERYVQALIWNKKFKPAADKISELTETYPNENWVLALSATLATYKSEMKTSIEFYKAILQNDLKSFDGNLGIASAYYAYGLTDSAYKAVYTTLEIFKDQNDAMNFLKKMNNDHTPKLEEKLSYAFDNGDNIAYAAKTDIVIPFSTKWSLNTIYQHRITENKVFITNAVTHDFLLGPTYKFHPRVSFTTNIGATSANAITKNYTSFMLHSYFKGKPMNKQDLEVGYKREFQNFNTDLIDRKIATNNFYFNNNFGTNFNLGWFTQYFYTTQSDENVRNLLFTSLYYTFLPKPVVKGGFNYQYLSFKEQVPLFYFSPSKFNAYEIFGEILMDENIVEANSLFYHLNLATGYQFIEDLDKQQTYRIQGKLGFKFSSRFLVNFYGLKSNIAAATVAGFTYTEFGFRLKWLFLPRPIFSTEKFKKDADLPAQ